MVTYCPYRICPLGAHVDHQNGYVSGAAINLGIYFKYELSYNPIIEISSFNYENDKIILINEDIYKKNDWADYFRGIVKIFKERYQLKRGLTGFFKGDLPSGGISSSSASQIAFIKALCNINDIELSKSEVLDIVYKVEKNFMKLSVGILDPSCELYSKSNSLLFLDTHTNYFQIVKNSLFNEVYQFIIIYSGIKRDLINSKYNERVMECNNASQKLYKDAKVLRDVSDYFYIKNMNKLTENEKKRCKHYYSEINRVKEGLKAWRYNDMKLFGKLMNESCISSINNYESGSNHLIDLFDIIQNIDGVLGTRFLGAGFNGSSLALIKKDKFIKIKDKIEMKYLMKYPNLKNDFKILRIDLVNGADI